MRKSVYKKIIFESFLKGYENQKKSYDSLLKSTGKSISHKEFKIERVLNYFGCSKTLKGPFLSIFYIMGFLEFPFSIFILLVRFLIVLVKKNKAKKNHLDDNILLSLSTKEPFYEGLMSNFNLNYSVLKIPFMHLDNSRHKEINVLSGVSIMNIIIAYLWSLQFVSKYLFHYSGKDLFFRFYSCFEYFLTYFFIINSKEQIVYYFFNTYDRWSYLMDISEHNTIWIQHGILYDDIKFAKLNNIKIAYYISPSQKNICESVLFNCKPTAFYRKTIELTPLDSCFYEIGKKNVLLICNTFFFENEKEIINSIDYNQYILILKTHPKHSTELYQKYVNNRTIWLAKPFTFPRVDYVISYASTLADEYEAVGIKVFRYDSNISVASLIINFNTITQ